jgi:hypothetical protein
MAGDEEESPMISSLLMALCAFSPCVVHAQDPAATASVTVASPTTEQLPEGRRVVQDVTLANDLASYTLRYDILELADEPGRVGTVKWAFTLGYVPLGIAGPSMALWYNQGFFIWTFDGEGIKEYPATFRVVREYGRDAMVEYVWDTPKVTATARFAITAGSDKLLFFGHYEPKEEVAESKLRLMCYPSTFDKPWVRQATTATRTVNEGAGTPLDLGEETWVLFEDVAPDRPGDGPAGLLLGDTSAFSQVTIDAGGYAEYANLTLAPDRRSFALGLYEFPDMPDPDATREYFRRSATAESAALAELLAADLDQPLAPLPGDPERVAAIIAKDDERLVRPAEAWKSSDTPLDFLWASNLAGPPVKVALLCARWSAYETMELGRRLPMDVEHLYFDTKTALANPSAWPYRNQTGIGTLGAGVAERKAVRVCSQDDREVILVAGLNASALPQRVRDVILDRVQSGAGLVLTGDDGMLGGWPEELRATEDETLVEPILGSFPWDEIPGLRLGERGRLGEGPPLLGYRCGEGRVIVFRARLGTYSSLIPLNDATEGLDGAMDRTLAMLGKAMLAAAGRELPVDLKLEPPTEALEPATPGSLAVSGLGPDVATAVVRLQDECDTVAGLHAVMKPGDAVPVPPLAAGRSYFADVLLLNAPGECLGYASTVVRVRPEPAIESVTLSPGQRVHPGAPTTVGLTEGGTLTCEVSLKGAAELEQASLLCEVRDCFDRLMMVDAAAVEGNRVRAELSLPRPVTVSHRLDLALMSGDRSMAVHRERFTIPIPYPYDDFTLLLWSYAGGEPAVLRTQELCYDLGTEMADLCHMRNYSDEGAAREYAVASNSGLRLVPYVTRIASTQSGGTERQPCLHDPAWIERERASMEICCRQAAPYNPPAYTLGDENYLSRGQSIDICSTPKTTADFRKWLQAKYETIDALNAVWHTDYADFAAITAPMTIDQAAEQTESFAPWLDHRAHMDTAFAATHELFADFVRREDPGAKVGWDGLLGYHWLAGYDFFKLCRNQELNEVYTSQWPQDEFVRCFAPPGALTGQWGNAIADKEDGFSAITWHNLFSGHNSCWWWTSWGCDYVPFNPDLSISKMGEWFFAGGDEVRSGPGKLLLHGKRDHSGVAVLYSQADLFAARLASKLAPEAAFAGDGAFLDDHRGLLRWIQDVGYQFEYIAEAELEQQGAEALADFRVLFLPLATCLSDRQVEAILAFARGGGSVVADGRVGLLTGDGAIRSERPLDELFGVHSEAGLEAFRQPSKSAELPEFGGEPLGIDLLEPGLTLAGADALGEIDGCPIFTTNDFGEGRAALLNLPFRLIGRLRGEGRERPAVEGLGGYLQERGMEPYCRLTTADGLTRCIEQVLFVDSGLRYLGLEQDILMRGLPAQQATLTLPEEAIVYDVRAGEQIGDGPTRSWPVELSRGRPQLFALLPYEVTAVQADCPATVNLGEPLSVSVAVSVDPGEAQYHVVRMDVLAPDSDRPHRQYSQNIACPAGKGEASIPFAMNDETGEWTLRFRDVASGMTATKALRVEG